MTSDPDIPDEDEDDDMPRCECCLSVCSPFELNAIGLCDFCIDDEDQS